MNFETENMQGRLSIHEMCKKLSAKEAKYWKEAPVEELATFLEQSVYSQFQKEDLAELYSLHFVESPSPKRTIVQNILEKAVRELRRKREKR